MNEKKIRSFTDLVAWQKGHELVLEIYKIIKKSPKEEIFGLTNQIQRSAVSVTSNIAEGFSRRSSKDKIKFYCMALGSLTELQNQLLISKDIGYIKPSNFKEIANKSVDCHKLINGLIKSSRLNSLY